MSELYSLLWPNNILLYVHTTFYLFIHLWMDVGVVPSFWLLSDALVNIGISVQVLAFSSFGCIPKNRHTESCANSVCLSVCVHAQSRPSLCDPMDCSQPGSSVHGIFQASVLEWVAIPFSRGSSTQGSNPCLLHLLQWQADSLPLHYLGSPSPSWMRLLLNFPMVF